MNLRQLKCFRKVAEGRSLSMAAEELYITQSAASQQVSSLERELGAELLHRNNNRLELTDAGIYFYNHIRQPIDDLDAAINGVKQYAVQQQETLVLGCYTVAHETIIPAFLSLFKQNYPDIKIELVLKLPQDLIRALNNREIDAAIMAPDDVYGEIGTARFYPLCILNLICIMTPDHPFASRDLLTWDDLRGETILYPTNHHLIWKTLDLIRAYLDSLRDKANLLFIDDSNKADMLLSSYSALSIRTSYGSVHGTTLTSVPIQSDYHMEYGLIVLPDSRHIVGKLISSVQQYRTKTQ